MRTWVGRPSDAPAGAFVRPIEGPDGKEIYSDLLFRQTSLERFVDKNGKNSDSASSN